MTIGVIGGVGAGKSTVLDLLESDYGYRVIKTDDVAKSFYVSGHPVFEKLKLLLGDDIEKPDGTADIPAFAKKLYGDGSGDLRMQVNAIVHPAVWKYVEDQIKAEERDVVVETALPAETFLKMCDEVWFVYTREDIRIGRLMETRGYTEKKARDMIHSQISDDAYSELASFVIDNSGSTEETADIVRAHLGDRSSDTDKWI